MKKLLMILVQWFLGLFKSKKEVIVEPAPKKTLEEKIEELKPYIKPKYHSRQMIPIHNNRKRTRGRNIQILPTGRVIYHYAK